MRRKDFGHLSCLHSLAGLLLALAWCLPQAKAQDQPAAEAPIPQVSEPEMPQVVPPHRFWDRTNILLFSGVGVFRGLDYASTRNFMARGREEILLPDDVVNNSAGFASLEAAATATSIGLSYWMHRAGHHKIERWISIVHLSVTAFGDARNYALKSKHP
jgi:hypothetical protein